MRQGTVLCLKSQGRIKFRHTAKTICCTKRFSFSHTYCKSNGGKSHPAMLRNCGKRLQISIFIFLIKPHPGKTRIIAIRSFYYSCQILSEIWTALHMHPAVNIIVRGITMIKTFPETFMNFHIIIFIFKRYNFVTIRQLNIGKGLCIRKNPHRFIINFFIAISR